MPSRPWWYPEYWARRGQPLEEEGGWSGRLPRRRRPDRASSLPRLFGGVILILVGAALSVLIVFPLLPSHAQIWVHHMQEEIAVLVPWSVGR
jgi:hypothetical protein